jgi:hypothetical protein
MAPPFVRRQASRALAISLALLTLPLAANGETYCRRTSFDADALGPLTGRYAIVGRSAAGAPYAGDLVLAAGKETLRVVRRIGKRRWQGEAWLEHCGPDAVERLVVRYPGATPLACYLRGDGDNFIRASCGDPDGRVLEAWFQRPLP